MSEDPPFFFPGGALLTPPGRAEAQDWGNSTFFVSYNFNFDQTDFISDLAGVAALCAKS